MDEGESLALSERRVERRWGYDTRFKYYLYRMGVLGNEGVESIHNFPERIELNDAWHNALERMKGESRDGRERWVPIGMKEDRSLDFIPETFVKGGFTQAHVLTDEEVRERYGVIYKIGDIHSHPSDWIDRLGDYSIVATRLAKDVEGFSPDDLKRIVDSSGLPLHAVVEKNHNYFAFRTAETRDLPPDSPLRSAVAFRKHWARKHGGYYLGESRLAFWASPKFSMREMNIGIAVAYNLALYKGKPGKDLLREYPLI